MNPKEKKYFYTETHINYHFVFQDKTDCPLGYQFETIEQLRSLMGAVTEAGGTASGIRAGGKIYGKTDSSTLAPSIGLSSKPLIKTIQFGYNSPLHFFRRP